MPPPSVPLPVFDYREGRGGVQLPGGIPASIPAEDRLWSPQISGGGGQGPYRPTFGDVRPDGKPAHGVMLVPGARRGPPQAWLHYRDDRY